jgi:hypothetical protein
MMNYVKTDQKTKKCIISSSKARMLLHRMIIHESNVFTVQNDFINFVEKKLLFAQEYLYHHPVVVQ